MAEPDDLAGRLQDALGEAYKVERRLGSGGFAVVFAVRDLNLKRNLAVKVVSPDLVSSRSVLERFRREAETVAQLSHPNIVPLHFVGQKDDLVYLVMQAVDGGTLADRLKREGPLPVDDAVRIICEVAAALAYAHKRGIVHRDIKPENVLLDAETGRALLSDFGIARTIEGESLTATGLVIGTVAYLSPEQAAGEPADNRSDIYALGVVAYEVISGKLPFTGPTPAAVLMKRLAGGPVPLTKLRAETPSVVASVVEQCMIIDPGLRLSDAGDVVRILKGESPVSGTRATRAYQVEKRKPGVRNIGIGLGVLTIVAIVVTAAQQRAASKGGGQPSSQVMPGSAGSAAASVDSGMIVIPGGSYTIGSDNGPQESRPAHAVDLQRFAIGAREVTVGEYGEFVNSGRAPAPWSAGSTLPKNIPVTGVTLAEAMSYCAWRHPNGGRLPTEEEWEAAARGSDGRLYPWGSVWDPMAANTGSRRDGPVAAGTFPRGKSALGVHDLIGNVWEWTSSPFRSYSNTSDTGTELYVIRGGAYNSYDQVATSVFRGRARPASPRADLARTGFRCAMNAPSK